MFKATKGRTLFWTKAGWLTEVAESALVNAGKFLTETSQRFEQSPVLGRFSRHNRLTEQRLLAIRVRIRVAVECRRKVMRASAEEVGMFGRVEKINNRNPSFPQSQCDHGGNEPIPGDFHLCRSCREFQNALQDWAKILSLHGSEMTIDCPNLKLARDRVNRSLHEIRGFRASSAIGFRTKIEAWLALEKLFGDEDTRVTAFACELAKEAYRFLSPGGLSTIGRIRDQRGDLRYRVAKIIGCWLGF
jgi:hypothetical protein